MMATSFTTTSYTARKRVGGISRAGEHVVGAEPTSRPRTTPRIGGHAAEHASGSISYLQPDPAWDEIANYPYARNSPLAFIDPRGREPITGRIRRTLPTTRTALGTRRR